MPTNGKAAMERCCWSQNKADADLARTAMLLRGIDNVIIAEGHWGIADINQETVLLRDAAQVRRNLVTRDNQSTTRQSTSPDIALYCAAIDAGERHRCRSPANIRSIRSRATSGDVV